MTRRHAGANPAFAQHDMQPPPSTLAAQIVQNQARTSTSQQNGDKATFAQLLHELLNNPAATPETDISVNVKLISVIAEAGLAPLADGNPFADWESLLPQAIDSITVIEATIKRQPDVLFESTTENGPQLVLFLLARLAVVCGHPKCEDIPVLRLLDATLAVLKASLDLWQYAHSLQQALQDCIDETIYCLETMDKTEANFSLKLPPARTVARTWSQSENEVALPHGSQLPIGDPSDAFVLALHLSTLTDIPAASAREAHVKLANLFERLKSKLESSGRYESAVRTFLTFPDANTILSHLLRETALAVPTHAIQQLMATSMFHQLRHSPTGCIDYLLIPLTTIADADHFSMLHEDLKIAIVTVLSRLLVRDELPEQAVALQDDLKQGTVMSDSELTAAFGELSVPPAESGPVRRWRKRRKLNRDKDGNYPSISSRQSALTRASPNTYFEFSEDQKHATWQGLVNAAAFQPQATTEAVSVLMEHPDPDQSKEIRVMSMLAVRSCVQNMTDPSHVDLRRSAFGQFCLRSLHSSLRELRFAAGSTLVAFLRDGLPEEVRVANRKVAIEYLRVLSDRNVACEHDTLIAAWGQVALACDDPEMNLALLRLVDYLGHANPLVCGLAFAELGNLAVSKKKSMEQLFRPFWGSIAVSIVQDLPSRPQKAQQFCDLMGVELNQLLIQTQQYTIPTLVLTKKKDILGRIATARGAGTRIADICDSPKTNLAAILGLLLSQPGPDPEDVASACLVEMSAELPDLSTLVKREAPLVGCFMLKSIARQHDQKKSLAYQAFQGFANIAQRRPGQIKAFSKASRTVADYFETHILGIIAHFGEVMENTQGLYPSEEKILCIKGIGEMIIMMKQQVVIALPQLRATLQSALEQEPLREVAFSVWLDLVSTLDSEEVGVILDQTFALAIRYWENLSPRLQEIASERISNLVKTHNQAVQENVMTLPSLKNITLLTKLAAEVERLKSHESVEIHCKSFAKRLRNESSLVVLRALEEIVPFLEERQDFIHVSAISEPPPVVLLDLLRALLDAGSTYAPMSEEAADNVGKALGIIGCVDPNRIEISRKKRKALVLSNFDKAEETIDWVIVLLEEVLVKAFKSVTNARAQGFLAYVIQELLRFCNFNDGTVLRPRASQANSAHQKWAQMPESVRLILTPFVKSRYVIQRNVDVKQDQRVYPGFSADESHGQWLRFLALDLMGKATGDNAKMVFPLLARVIRGHDLSIASFLLPYAMLNIVLGSTVSQIKDMSNEIQAVLGCQSSDSLHQETIRQSCESIFNVLDYMSTWLQEKKKYVGEIRSSAYRTGHSPGDFDEAKDIAQIDAVEQFLASIPAEMIASQAILCGSFARAAFHWEQFIRQKRPLIPSTASPHRSAEDESMYNRLHDIYAQIDEPDGLEGISAHLPFLNEEQQALQHAKAGRWTAAQSWYDSELAKQPGNPALEDNVLRCLRETGQYGPLLRYADSFIAAQIEPSERLSCQSRLLPVSVEAEWMVGGLHDVENRVKSTSNLHFDHFNLGVAKALVLLNKSNNELVAETLTSLRTQVTQGMTTASTSSVHASHDDLRKLHLLYEIEALSRNRAVDNVTVAQMLERRLSVLGSYTNDKQTILGIRRLIMQAFPDRFDTKDLGGAWLISAKLARQSKNTQQAYHAVLRANDYEAKTAKLEEARLLWRDGHQRHAIQALQSSIDSGVFESLESAQDLSFASSNLTVKQDMLTARAKLLLAKWLDASGQTQTKNMTELYQSAAKNFQRWEKGHYYLGKHYQKILEAEKALPKDKQSPRYRGGELTRLVIENLLRSVPFGNKYWHETIPKLLTLWLDLAVDALKSTRGEDQSIVDMRRKTSAQATKQLQKYFDRVPVFVFYTAMPQMISRITHPDPEVWKQLRNILSRIVAMYPSQALWSLLAVTKASDRSRVEKGQEIISRLKDRKANTKNETPSADLRMLIAQGQKLSDGLLQACEAHVEQRVTGVSLSKDLGFNHKLAPSPLVVPIEITLAPSLPSGASVEAIRKHKAFVQDKVTIQSFADHVLVLSSLQRPRKLTVRGSDGKQYGLLCKPKDDLRKDQRLMEFNGIINRALKRDAESSKRRLYIKTYAVTPLSEESGTIEWVEGIKPMRDILLGIYNRKGVRPNYPELRRLLDDASKTIENVHIFNDKVLPTFQPVLHEWFTEVYPEPDEWFAARLRYARSAAVMSVTGHVLGLGDRHGENILLEEGTGGVFHVDFNCLFDKGLTFEKPEVVPFRLTHNMVDAMGPYGYEGPFRKSSELTLKMLRQSKDTLMTILETFLYDPTTDFVGKKKRSADGVPETPPEILDSVDGKLKGFLRGEAVPLGVEGYVDALIREATSPWNLARMYIGWCAFL